MLNVFSKEYLNVLKQIVKFNKNIGIKHFSTYNKNHTSFNGNLKNTDKFRTFSKEEIERLPFSTPYFEYNEGNYLDAPLDISTDSVSETPLLTRSNVGVGFLTLNSEYLGAGSVGSLCRELSDLEVNVYKRFDILTSVTRSVFSKGLDLFEISLFFESYSRLAELMYPKKYKQISNSLQNSLNHNMKIIEKGLEDYLDNICDLLYIIKTYKKPLIVYGNGQMDERYFNNFGCTYVLSNLKANLGEYLLFTNDKMVGEDLVLSGLVKRYIDPESINNMQIVSDRLVELPEKYVERHICDFTSRVSEENKFYKFWDVMNYHFDHDNVSDIIDSLNKSYTKGDYYFNVQKTLQPSEIIEFENSILKKFKNNPLGTKRIQYFLNIIKRLKIIRYQILTKLEISPKEWNQMISVMYKPTVTFREENMKMLYNMISEVLLVESLGMEMELFYKYPYLDEIENNNTNNKDTTSSLEDYSRNKQSKWKVKNMGFKPDMSREERRLEELKTNKMIIRDNYEYKIYERNPMSLSNLLSLKKLNINYNPKTKCEYDKVLLNELEKRYKPDHLKETFKLMKNILNIDY